MQVDLLSGSDASERSPPVRNRRPAHESAVFDRVEFVPLAASQSSDVAFVVAVSGCQLPAWRQDLYRVENELRADGFDAVAIKDAMTLTEMRMELMRGNGSFEELDETQKSVLARPWFDYVHYCDRKRFESGRRTVGYDPAPAWAKVSCPVLAIFGDKDRSCPVEPSAEIIRTVADKAGNNDVTVRIIANASHNLTVARTGGRKEAAERLRARPAGSDPEFAPGFVDAMSGWMAARFSR